MIIRNTTNNYNKIYRGPSSIQLFKMLKEYTEEVVVEDNTDGDSTMKTIVTGRDWEVITIPRTSATEPVSSGEGDDVITVDPVVTDFENYFNQGVLQDQTKIMTKKLTEAKALRWSTTDEFVITHAGFTNLASERNMSMQLIAAERVLTSDVRWMNLDATYIQIDELNRQDFIDFTDKAKAFTQASFDTLSAVIRIIEIIPLDEIELTNVRSIWTEQWDLFRNEWETKWAPIEPAEPTE